MSKHTKPIQHKKDWKLTLCNTAGIIMTVPTFLLLVISIPMTVYALYLNIVDEHEKEQKTKKVLVTLFVLLFLIAGLSALVWAFFYKPDLYCALLFINIILSIVSLITLPKKDR